MMLIRRPFDKSRGRSMVQPMPKKHKLPIFYFHYAPGFEHPNTRTIGRLLGPCFKTGRLRPFRQHRYSGRYKPPQSIRNNTRSASRSDIAQTETLAILPRKARQSKIPQSGPRQSMVRYNTAPEGTATFIPAFYHGPN